MALLETTGNMVILLLVRTLAILLQTNRIVLEDSGHPFGIISPSCHQYSHYILQRSEKRLASLFAQLVEHGRDAAHDHVSDCNQDAVAGAVGSRRPVPGMECINAS